MLRQCKFVCFHFTFSQTLDIMCFYYVSEEHAPSIFMVTFVSGGCRSMHMLTSFNERRFNERSQLVYLRGAWLFFAG